ncbi:MAG: hypothetical protein QOG54_2682 [Actinomycetota bacterium]|jgi:hypothetical protein|nr:hypothetical protein [Actinomycetota bacterium]
MQQVDSDRRARAYRAGAQIARSQIAADAPEDAQALADVQASDIVVVAGTYDHVEKVLGALEMPHTRIGPDDFAGVRLRPDQLLVVNCPGNLPPRAIPGIADFVAQGGSLFTTDWALKHVIEPAFPGTISFNRRPTADDVVRVEIADHDNPFIKGVLDDNDDPQWWLEASSYPITIHDASRVKVLLSSSELAARYGESPVAVLFGHGGGEVFHMISHYYLQRTELRSARHTMPASAWAAEKSVAVSPAAAAEMADLNLGEVESAGSSARLFANVVAQHKRRTS